jgi:hypothetical protein
LAVNPPPAGWQPRPIPEPVSWDALQSLKGQGSGLIFTAVRVRS